MDTIQNSRVVVISGETGCGKSTQLPQFILQYAIESKNEHVDVICTQPRRISAVSLAERVGQEMADPGHPGADGTWVGYQVRLENQISADTRLRYITTGVLLRRLASDAKLQGVTHVVIDEVHERSLDSDLLLYCMKKVLLANPRLKLILMSATLESEKFVSYFSSSMYSEIPCFKIPGKTFPVQVMYLEEAIQLSGYVVDQTRMKTQCTRNSCSFSENANICKRRF